MLAPIPFFIALEFSVGNESVSCGEGHQIIEYKGQHCVSDLLAFFAQLQAPYLVLVFALILMVNVAPRLTRWINRQDRTGS